MRGAVLHAPGDVRVEERDDPTIDRADRRDHPPVGHLRLRLRPVALPRHREPSTGRHRWATSTSASSRRSAATSTTSSPASSSSARSSPPTTPARSAGPATRPRCVHRELMGAIGTQAEYARIPLADGTLVATPDVPVRRPGPEPPRRLRRARHRLVRRRRRRGRPGQDRRRRRRRRGRPARRPRRQAARRRADHRHEPPRVPPEARPRVRRHRHRRPNAATTASPGSRTSPTGSAPTRSSRPSAPRSR